MKYILVIALLFEASLAATNIQPSVKPDQCDARIRSSMTSTEFAELIETQADTNQNGRIEICLKRTLDLTGMITITRDNITLRGLGEQFELTDGISLDGAKGFEARNLKLTPSTTTYGIRTSNGAEIVRLKNLEINRSFFQDVSIDKIENSSFTGDFTPGFFRNAIIQKILKTEFISDESFGVSLDRTTIGQFSDVKITTLGSSAGTTGLNLIGDSRIALADRLFIRTTIGPGIHLRGNSVIESINGLHISSNGSGFGAILLEWPAQLVLLKNFSIIWPHATPPIQNFSILKRIENGNIVSGASSCIIGQPLQAPIDLNCRTVSF